MYDYAAIVADFEAFLLEDGRSSHGTDFLTRKLAELRAAHRIDEDAYAAFMRRFGTHFTEVFLGLVPASATPDPLPAADRQLADSASSTGAGMDEGAASDHPQQGSDACPPTHRFHVPQAVSPMMTGRMTAGQPAAATR